MIGHDPEHGCNVLVGFRAQRREVEQIDAAIPLVRSRHPEVRGRSATIRTLIALGLERLKQEAGDALAR